MVVVGADVHKRTHTFVATDEVGRKVGEKVVAATSSGHAEAVMWARERFADTVVWAIEDCRHLSARLERDLLTAGQQVVRVPPKFCSSLNFKMTPFAEPMGSAVSSSAQCGAWNLGATAQPPRALFSGLIRCSTGKFCWE